MTRVSTFGNYSSALLDLQASQARMAEANERLSTQKNATDLSGFGRKSEVLTALKGAQVRTEGYLETAKAVASRLTTQDLAMNQVGDSILALRDAVANALSADTGVTLDTALQNNFDAIRGALNTQHLGAYLFAGAATSTAPVSAQTLADLTGAPAVADVFENDNLKTVSRVSEDVSIETGVLASDFGGEIMGIMRDIQNYHTGGTGPLTGKLTAAQKTFLTTQLDRLNVAYNNSVNTTAAIGLKAQRTDAVIEQHENQIIQLKTTLSGHTDADLAKAATDIELSQMAIQASAQVITALRGTSLLDFLR